MAYLTIGEEITGTMNHPYRQWVVRLISESLGDMAMMLAYNTDKKQMLIIARALRDELGIELHGETTP